MDNVLLSIIIPVYNGGDCLTACLDSLLNQTNPGYNGRNYHYQ